MAKMQALEDSLKQQDEDHQDEIYKLERKQVVDKDRLKKEMVMRVNQVGDCRNLILVLSFYFSVHCMLYLSVRIMDHIMYMSTIATPTLSNMTDKK